MIIFGCEEDLINFFPSLIPSCAILAIFFPESADYSSLNAYYFVVLLTFNFSFDSFLLSLFLYFYSVSTKVNLLLVSQEFDTRYLRDGQVLIIFNPMSSRALLLEKAQAVLLANIYSLLHCEYIP